MSKAAQSFDVIVLGGGTGGYVAAIHAAQLGLNTALIEAGKVGGTCLHRGCIPTKALLETAHVLHTVKHREDYGVIGQGAELNYGKVLSRKDKVVTQLWKGVQYLLKKNNVEVFEGWGQLTGPQQVTIQSPSGQQIINGRDILIATGSVPREIPVVPFDGSKVLSSDHVLDRDEVPGSVIILGGGAIGVEFASMYNDYGAQVTLVEMLPHILPQDDKDIAQELTRSLSRRGVQILTDSRFDLESVQIHDDGVTAQVLLSTGEQQKVSGDVLLVAVGRQAVIENIGLEAVGVQTERGYITVDSHYRTSVPHVYAIGDVIGGYLLAHVAAHEGMIAVETMAGKNPELLDPTRVPRVTYSRPEVASVGLTADEAVAAGHKVREGVFPFRGNGRSLILGESEGMVKLVADETTDILLGAHIVGPRASELINEMALAKFLEGTAWEIAESVHAHPTVSEVLHEAGLAVDGMAIHV